MLEMTIVEIRDEYDIVVARMEAKEEARKIGFGIVDQTRIATAVSELATSLSMEEVRIQINVIRAANAAAAVWRRVR